MDIRNVQNGVYELNRNESETLEKQDRIRSELLKEADEDVKELLGKYDAETIQGYSNIVDSINEYWKQTKIPQKEVFVNDKGTH